MGWCEFIKQINIFIENLMQECEDLRLNFGWLQADEPEGLARDTLHHVYELVQKGNEAFRENRMEAVITIVS